MKLNGSFYLVLGCAQVAASAVLPVIFPKDPSEEAPDVNSIYPTLESETSGQSPPLVKKLYAEIMLLRAPRPVLEAPSSSKSFTLPPLSKHRIPKPKSHPLSDPDRKESGEGNANDVWDEETTGESSVEGQEDGRMVQLIDIIMASPPAPPASSSTVWPSRPACLRGVLPSDRNETLLVYLALAFVVIVVVCETLREAVGR